MASDFTWQAMASIGYHINDSSSVALGYRAIGTDYTNNDITYDVTSHGLLLGYEMKF
jgi:opacity protein-like surface antigen